ncbi:MAG: hypothetical protein HY050_05265 [Actinobacteria bacterium]|nr:hypothetical protein [Actinomycetota bacterium]
MKKSLPRKHHPKFANDIRILPTRNLQRLALQKITDVSNGSLTGIPLEDHPAVGDLSDCRKIYFDERDDIAPRYRLVYRLLPNEVEAVCVEAITVGERNALQVYVEAARRLGRLVNEE